jgi:adenylate cyclase class IV
MDINILEKSDYVEKRCKIKDVDDTRKIIETIGGIYKGYYSATDIIFKPKKAESEEGTIVLRVFKINSRQTKNIVLTHKIAEWDDKIKTDRIILKKKFDTIGKAILFIIDRYGIGTKDDYTYSRDGWEYHLDKNRVFIEYIEKLGPTMEIESDNKKDLENLFKHFEITECFSEPVSEVMRKLIKFDK